MLVPAALATLALIHAYWGAKMLLHGNVMLAGTQIVSAGGILLVAVAIDRRPSGETALGFGIAGAATAVRLLVNLIDSPGPFTYGTALLAAGMLAIAWGANRLAHADLRPAAPLAIRAGGVLMAIAYATFLGLGVAFGGSTPANVADLVLRAAAILTFVALVDLPSLAPKDNAFVSAPPMRAR